MSRRDDDDDHDLGFSKKVKSADVVSFVCKDGILLRFVTDLYHWQRLLNRLETEFVYAEFGLPDLELESGTIPFLFPVKLSFSKSVSSLSQQFNKQCPHSSLNLFSTGARSSTDSN